MNCIFRELILALADLSNDLAASSISTRNRKWFKIDSLAEANPRLMFNHHDKMREGSKLRPKVLQHVAVPVIENHVCEGWHRRKGIDIRIYDEMMCAGYELGQRDACQVSVWSRSWPIRAKVQSGPQRASTNVVLVSKSCRAIPADR